MSTVIMSAAFARLSTLANKPPIAWPGVDFVPPTSGPWLEISVFPNEPDTLGMSADAVQLEIGFVQVLACNRPGSGTMTIATLAEAVAAHYPKALELGPVRVRAKPWLSPAVIDDDRIFVPVTIPYRG